MRFALVILMFGAVIAGAYTLGKSMQRPDHELNGLASWYGERYHGKTTACGEPFDMRLFTAAHRTLPCGAKVRVENLNNGKAVVVRINDRGPFIEGRVIDLSRAAARKVDMVEAGVAEVTITILSNQEDAP